MREEIIGDCRLILGDCREAIKGIAAFDLGCTSPPYGDMRDYGGHGVPDTFGIHRARFNPASLSVVP